MRPSHQVAGKVNPSMWHRWQWQACYNAGPFGAVTVSRDGVEAVGEGGVAAAGALGADGGG